MLRNIKKKYYLKKLKATLQDDPEILENWIETIEDKNSVQRTVGEFYKFDTLDLFGVYPKRTLPKERGDSNEEYLVRQTIRTRAIKLSFYGIFGAEIYFKMIKARKEHRTLPEQGCNKGYFEVQNGYRPETKLTSKSNTPIEMSYPHEDGSFRTVGKIAINLEFDPRLLGSKLYVLCNAYKYGYHNREVETKNPIGIDGLTWKMRRQNDIAKLIEKYPELSLYFDGCREEKNLLKSFDEDNLTIKDVNETESGDYYYTDRKY